MWRAVVEHGATLQGCGPARVRAPALPLVTCATGIGLVIMRVTSGIDPARIARTCKIFWRIDIQAQFRCLKGMHGIDGKLPQARSEAAVTAAPT